MRRRLAAGLLVATLPLTACGNGIDGRDAASVLPAGPEIAASADHNSADVAFVTAMVQHDAQALALVDLTEGHDLSGLAGALVEEFRASRPVEIERLVDLLNRWDRPVPATVRDHANGGHGDDGSDGHSDEGGHGAADDDTGGDLPGMPSQRQVADVVTSAEADFERRWGELMAEHQEGAIAMLRAVLARGEDDATRALATELLEARREELAGLRDLPGA